MSFMCSILTLINIPLLSWTPGNNSVLLKYATTHATADWGTAHELRPRLFPTFVVNSLPLWSNSASLQVILLLLCMVLDKWDLPKSRIMPVQIFLVKGGLTFFVQKILWLGLSCLKLKVLQTLSWSQSSFAS